MKKKTLTALALGAATVATGMASNVHADSVTVTKQQVGDETKITTTTTKEADQQKVAQDKQAISSQQKVVDSAKSSLDSAKANANSTSQAVSSAQSKVDDTKKALDNAKDQVSKVSSSEIKQQVAQDQSQVTQDKQDISNTQSSIQQDQTKVDQDKQAVANAGQKAQQDQQKLNDDQGKLSDAQNTLNNDQGKLNDVNKQIEQADVPAAVQIPGDIAKAIVSGDPSSLTSDDFNANLTAYQQAINEFKPTDADNYHVDPRNLTNDQKMELSKFAAQVINEYKDEMAQYDPSNKILATHMNASQIAIDIAQGQADYMSQNGYTNYTDNDDSNVDNDYGSIIANYDKNKYDYSHTTSAPLSSVNSTTVDNCTMNDLKHQLYNMILMDLFNDSSNNYNHAQDLLYSTYDGIASTNMNDPFLAITTVANYNDQTNNSDPYLQPEAAPDIAALRNQASQLQNTVNADKQTVSDLTNQVNADKAQLEADTPAGLQKQLEDDQAKLANDQATLKQQQDKLAKDEAQLKADQDKLNSISPAEVAKAQQQLEEAQANYNNAVKALNDAQSKANASNDEVAKAQQNYLDALNKLNELKKVLENDEKETTTTSVQWVKNEHPTTTASMGNKVVLSSSKNTPEAPQKASTSATTSAVSSSKKQSAYLTTTVTPAKSSSVEENNTVHADTIHFTSEAPQSSVKKEAKQNTMPQMGDENSNATVWGEISLAMAGVLATLGLAGKKRRN